MMTFGLYRGLDIRDVPSEYLRDVSKYLAHEAIQMHSELKRRGETLPAIAFRLLEVPDKEEKFV